MLEQGHKLEIGGESMVGWCMAHKRARIALDVGQEAVRFENPLLPETRSELALPLISRGEVIGAMTIQSAQEAAFSEEDIAVLQTMAGQVANVIENARLFEETRSRAEELAVLNDLAQALTARLNVDQVLEETYRGVARLLDATNFFIGLYDPEKHEIVYPINVTESVIDREISILPAEQGISGYIVRHGTSVLIEGNVGKWEAEHGIDSVGEPANSWLGVPLMLGDQTLGVMAVQSYTDSRLYSEHDRDMLVAIANQAAVALQNAQLFEEARASERRLQRQIVQQNALIEIGRAVSQMVELKSLLDTVYQQTQRIMQVDAFFLALYDESAGVLTYPFIYDEGQRYYDSDTPSPLRGMLRQVIHTGEPLLVNRTPEEVDATVLTSETAMGNVQKPSASLLYAPLRIGSRIMGGLSVQSYNFNAYDEGDVTLLAGVANQVAIAIQNARLFEQAQTQAEQERRVRTITDRIRQGADREAIMRIALRELGQMLGASKSGATSV
jgi:GAF domain-containing protein